MDSLVPTKDRVLVTTNIRPTAWRVSLATDSNPRPYSAKSQQPNHAASRLDQDPLPLTPTSMDMTLTLFRLDTFLWWMHLPLTESFWTTLQQQVTPIVLCCIGQLRPPLPSVLIAILDMSWTIWMPARTWKIWRLLFIPWTPQITASPTPPKSTASRDTIPRRPFSKTANCSCTITESKPTDITYTTKLIP